MDSRLWRVIHVTNGKEDSMLHRTIYQGGTAGKKPSRPYLGMRGFFYLPIGKYYFPFRHKSNYTSVFANRRVFFRKMVILFK